MFAKNLLGAGVAPLTAQQMVGTVATGLTGAGTNQATALAVSADINVVTTTGASTGAIVPTSGGGDVMWVVNYGANTLSVYPPTGGKINNGSANAAFSVAANKVAVLICLNTIDFAAIVLG